MPDLVFLVAVPENGHEMALALIYGVNFRSVLCMCLNRTRCDLSWGQVLMETCGAKRTEAGAREGIFLRSLARVLKPNGYGSPSVNARLVNHWLGRQPAKQP